MTNVHKFRTALFIGRFQPFHNGHLYSLKKAWEMAERVIVGVGSSQESGTENHPWDFEKRKQMIESVAPRVEIVAIPDTPSDEAWLSEVEARCQKLDFRKETGVVVSNNEWVLSIMKKAGYETYETGLFNRDELEGVKIRALMRAGDSSWKSRVLEQVARQIDVLTI